MSIHKTIATVCFVLLAANMVSLATPGPGVVRPWNDTGIPLDVGRPVHESGNRGTVGLQEGADHIVGQQCGNGGFGWPHNDCTTTFNNITGPICLGLLDAYPHTADASHLNAAVLGGGYDLTFQYGNGEFRFSSFTAYFLSRLSAASGDGQYSNHAATKFFDELDAGTYGPGDLNTAGWIASVQADRAGTWVNLLPWEFQYMIQTSAAIGNPGQDAAFQQALLDGLNTLDSTDPFHVYSDLLGLAGGVRGLALAGVTSFPPINSPNHAGINGISTLKDLADKLASYQNADGSWYWHSNIPGPVLSDEDTQTSAYAVLALKAADPLVSSDYAAAVTNGRTWIRSMQLGSGGFLGYPGGDENTEVEGEALSAIADTVPTAVPAVSELGLVALTLVGVGVGVYTFVRRRRPTMTA